MIPRDQLHKRSLTESRSSACRDTPNEEELGVGPRTKEVGSPSLKSGKTYWNVNSAWNIQDHIPAVTNRCLMEVRGAHYPLTWGLNTDCWLILLWSAFANEKRTRIPWFSRPRWLCLVGRADFFFDVRMYLMYFLLAWLHLHGQPISLPPISLPPISLPPICHVREDLEVSMDPEVSRAVQK